MIFRYQGRTFDVPPSDTAAIAQLRSLGAVADTAAAMPSPQAVAASMTPPAVSRPASFLGRLIGPPPAKEWDPRTAISPTAAMIGAWALPTAVSAVAPENIPLMPLEAGLIRAGGAALFGAGGKALEAATRGKKATGEEMTDEAVRQAVLQPLGDIPAGMVKASAPGLMRFGLRLRGALKDVPWMPEFALAEKTKVGNVPVLRNLPFIRRWASASPTELADPLAAGKLFDQLTEHAELARNAATTHAQGLVDASTARLSAADIADEALARAAKRGQAVSAAERSAIIAEARQAANAMLAARAPGLPVPKFATFTPAQADMIRQVADQATNWNALERGAAPPFDPGQAEVISRAVRRKLYPQVPGLAEARSAEAQAVQVAAAAKRGDLKALRDLAAEGAPGARELALARAASGAPSGDEVLRSMAAGGDRQARAILTAKQALSAKVSLPERLTPFALAGTDFGLRHNPLEAAGILGGAYLGTAPQSLTRLANLANSPAFQGAVQQSPRALALWLQNMRPAPQDSLMSQSYPGVFAPAPPDSTMPR